MATAGRRTITGHTKVASSSSKANVDADELAKDFSKKLALKGTNAPTKRAATSREATLKAKGKQKELNAASSSNPPKDVQEKSPEQAKIASMQAVNAASQALSSVVQSGWKRSSAVPVLSSDKNTIMLVQNSAAAAAKHLATLRSLTDSSSAFDSGGLDVERAAGSIVAKLVALEVFDTARSALREIYPRLCLLFGVPFETKVTNSSNLWLLSIPQAVQFPSSPILLNILSTYLLCALILACRPVEENSVSSPNYQWIDDLATYLNSTSAHSLISWIPCFQENDVLPSKHVDSLLTRAYTALTKLCSSASSHPGIPTLKAPVSRVRAKSTSSTSVDSLAINPSFSSPNPSSLFSLRIYALRCLCYTSSGVIEPKTFWDQGVRFTTTYVKTSSQAASSTESNLQGTEEATTKEILGAFTGLHSLACLRKDKLSFTSVDNGFGDFCESWAGFAKRAGDISLLQRIHSLQNPSSSYPMSSSHKPSTSLSSGTLNVTDNDNDSTSAPVSLDSREASLHILISQGVKIANTLAQLSVVLEKAVKDKMIHADEQEVDQLLSLAQEITTALKHPFSSGYLTRLFIPFQYSNQERTKIEDQMDRVSGKVDRAFERVRRLSLRIVEMSVSSPDATSSKLDDALRILLICFVDCFEALLSSSPSEPTRPMTQTTTLDIVTRTLDTLFILSRTGMKANDPTTFVPGFELLMRGKAVLENQSSPSTNENTLCLERANLRRCISGAFYNIAGMLYQAMRYGNAVAFLKEGCTIGEQALQEHALCLKTQHHNEGNTPRDGIVESKALGKPEEWIQLEEQLSRRWELLGVCYSKAGDRRKSYDAFKRAIQAFPFELSGLTQRIRTLAPDMVFTPGVDEKMCNPQIIKQLVGLIDRVTYIGTCELFLAPSHVSLCFSTTNSVSTSPRRHRKQSSAASVASTHRRASSSVGSFDIPRVDLDPSILGILLERQLDSLDASRWKEGVKGVYVRLLQDALDVYSVKESESVYRTPVRRARLMVRCLEFMYREGSGDGEFGFGGPSGPDVMLSEVETMCTSQSLQADAELSRYTHQYRISANLWVALHAHKRGDEAQNTVMTMRSEEACRLIQDLLGTSPAKTLRSPYATRHVGSPKVVRKGIISPARPGVEGSTPKIGMVVSPPRTRMTRTTKVPAAPRKATSGKKATVTGKASSKIQGRPKALLADPSTPRMTSRMPDEPKRTPPRPSVDGSLLSKSPFIFDNFASLLSLLQLVARLLGLLSLILAKAHLLDMTRKLAQRHAGIASDGYILTCVDLAHGYVSLGKVKRAAAIFKPALEIVQNGQASEEASVRLLLRFSEHLAAVEEIPKRPLVFSAKIYQDAFEIWKRLDLNEQKSSPTQQRILAKARMLEVTATAAHVFAAIQYTKSDVCASLDAFLQSLRLWNRAVDILSRLRPSPTGASENDPFEMTSLKDALPVTATAESSAAKTVKPVSSPRLAIEGLDWRIFEGLLTTLFAVAELYNLRGSAREADYFAKQAADLAEQLNTPAMLSRAFARQAEIQLHMGRLQEAREKVQQASVLVQDMPGLDQADVRRLKVELKVKNPNVNGEDEEEQSGEEDPKEMFDETVAMLQELDEAFLQFDSLAFGPRRSLGTSPGILTQLDVLAPQLLSTVLCQQLWLLRDDAGDVFDGILEKFLSLSSTKRAKAEEHILMAKLVMHTVYGRFRGDMFLSSLTESTIATPTGMTAKNMNDRVAPAKDILDSLSRAEKLLWDHLRMVSNVGSVLKIRETTLSLVMISAFRTSLGDCGQDLPLVMATLLDISAALTLRRDMLESISRKIRPQLAEDLRWPSFSEEAGLLPTAAAMDKRLKNEVFDSEEEDDQEHLGESDMLTTYWTSIRAKYDSQLSDLTTLATPDTSELPPNWTIINISLSPDNSSLLMCRREGGRDIQKPLFFCIPLKGRRDHGGEEDEDYLAFPDAIGELRYIVRSSDECTKAAVKIKPDDSEARSDWWKQRRQLDTRLRQLLENIEYCWLGAFKTILSPRPNITSDDIQDLRTQLEKVFHGSLHIKEKKIKKNPRKKNSSQSQAFSPSQFQLDDNLLRCLSTLSPKCRDEELEDLIYFVLDLYQLHGVPIAIAEVDVDQMVVDLRMIFEEHSAKHPKAKMAPDEHIFLILDKNVQGLPWESIPILRGRSVSRIPGVQFLHDRVAFAKCRQNAVGQNSDSTSGAFIDSRKGYFILNPSGDLSGTEERFRGWAEGMQAAGWDGTIGKPVSEQQFLNALRSRDLVVYFGHGGGEQYVRSHQIRNLPTCAATMLWGCSSGALKEMGDFDRTGTPYNYMLAGCPTLVANLWDVTDRDIDKFSLAVFDHLSLSREGVDSNRPHSSKTSLVTAVAQSRDSCKLKYLTGAAPIVYGIPFYL
ncbi:peptidase family C50-domain-containing protein [Crepidotus variabilis]|uniref:separase n=1 Tax=Crepidotus variabilis TaxID=179855 RepID=A0A9P6JQ65_9AGAR|nr:peptidase family C50-domain-containing protein [Crepidotus variabilis]